MLPIVGVQPTIVPGAPFQANKGNKIDMYSIKFEPKGEPDVKGSSIELPYGFLIQRAWSLTYLGPH